jgi:hypothetical protein
MKKVLLPAIVALLTAGIVYGLVARSFTEDIAEANEEIVELNSELLELLTSQDNKSVPTPAPPPPVDKEVELTLELCFKCHDKGQISSFHYPERIKLIDEEKGRPIRICTTCHGEPVMPVHFSAIQRKVVKCEACHIRGGGGFTVPEKRKEDLLICQLCHARGNYIAIHIDGDILRDAEIDSKWIRKRDGLECTICHGELLYGDRSILDIHQEQASEAGKLPKKVIDLFGERNRSEEFMETVDATTITEIG